VSSDPTAAERQRRRRERLRQEAAALNDAREVDPVTLDDDDFDDLDEVYADADPPDPKPKKAEPPPGAKQRVVLIYRPNPDDPSETTWNGIKFRANEPVTLERGNPKHSYVQLLPDKEARRHPLTGMMMTNHVDTLVFMGDAAAGSCFFEVDGQISPKPPKIDKKVPPAGVDWEGTNREEVLKDVVWPADTV
jgi:hypothetical protein